MLSTLLLRDGKLNDFHQVTYARVDQTLVTKLVERWPNATHPFHLLLYEASITFLHVVVLSQLFIEVHVAFTVSRQLHSWQDIIQWVLEQRPPDDMSQGSASKARWMIDIIRKVPIDADEVIIESYAKVFFG